MKKLLIIFLVFSGGSSLCGAQELDQYRYVQVPESFDFLSEKNQYQLNALTAFLFEKYGFEAIYQEEIPEDADICEVLKADVKKDNSLFTTKLILSLENCRREIVFTSKTGKSREKEFKAGYHEALRDAFTSLEEVNYSYSGGAGGVASPPQKKTNPGISPKIAESQKPQTDSAEVVQKVITAGEPAAEKMVAEKALPEVVDEDRENSPLNFRNGTSQYTLKATASGFQLFRKGDSREFATLLRSSSGNNFIYAAKSVQGSAFFNADGNLVVEYVDTNTGQLVTLQYQRED